MRNLTQAEIEEALDDNGESEESGVKAIEATVQELADLDVETSCGQWNNTTFKALAAKGYGHRKCRGWLFPKPPVGDIEEKRGPMVSGMFHIKIQTDKTAGKVERIAADAKGSLRFNGDSQWNGFKEFEIE